MRIVIALLALACILSFAPAASACGHNPPPPPPVENDFGC